MNRLEVKASKLPLILAILLGLFFVPLGLVSLITGLVKGFEVVPLGIGFMSNSAKLIFLCGKMASGKSTLARDLAQLENAKFEIAMESYQIRSCK